LRAGIDTILKYVTWVLIPVGALTIWNQFASGEDWRDAVRGLVAALVPLVPEGLVLMTSIAMVVGVVRLGRYNCLVQDLPAIEQLARVDVVCTDKTGTLTEDGMRVARVERVDGTELDARSAGEIAQVLATIGRGEGKPNSSMEAILEHVASAKSLPAAVQIAFSSARKWAAVQLESPVAAGDAGAAVAGDAAAAGTALSWVLGAPDVVFAESPAILEHVDTLSATGLRMLAVASSSQPLPETGLPTSLTPAALIVLDQRLRVEAPGAIDYFTKQQVDIKVISGDNAAAVGAIAEQVGVPDGRNAVDARTLDEDAPEFTRAVTEHTTFGRVTPSQKRAMVHSLQSEGRVVAMTGDGVNDVLALKDADVGVAMGSGSPAARAVSRIVLLDNSFATLPHVVADALPHEDAVFGHSRVLRRGRGRTLPVPAAAHHAHRMVHHRHSRILPRARAKRRTRARRLRAPRARRGRARRHRRRLRLVRRVPDRARGVWRGFGASHHELIDGAARPTYGGVLRARHGGTPVRVVEGAASGGHDRLHARIDRHPARPHPVRGRPARLAHDRHRARFRAGGYRGAVDHVAHRAQVLPEVLEPRCAPGGLSPAGRLKPGREAEAQPGGLSPAGKLQPSRNT